MAIYHLRLKVISRALGRAPRPGGATRRSAVAAAAYRSGERLFDAAQGIWFSYDKPDVVHSEILAPVEREAAPWVYDRQTLWNQVEAAEKRVDAQLYREVEITLPRELSRADQLQLVRQFVRTQFVAKGMVADWALHAPPAADGLEQPHAHVLLTLRRLDPNTQSGFSRTKERDWNEPPDIARAVAEARKRFNNTGLAEDHEALERMEALRNVNVWRAAWAQDANDALAQAGSAARIDHRTLEKQGIFRLPQISLGIAAHIEKAYDYLRDRVTQWVAIKKRASLHADVEHIKRRDPVALVTLLTRLNDIAEDFAASFKRNPHPDKDHGHEH